MLEKIFGINVGEARTRCPAASDGVPTFMNVAAEATSFPRLSAHHQRLNSRPENYMGQRCSTFGSTQI